LDEASVHVRLTVVEETATAVTSCGAAGAVEVVEVVEEVSELEDVVALTTFDVGEFPYPLKASTR
jgi:hypothetical protein